MHHSTAAPRTIYAADLYCGSGGTTQGFVMATRDIGVAYESIAINHSPIAIQTHTLNHPDIRHLCEDMTQVSPRDEVPGGYLDFLWASPQCTGFSNARGGKPTSDQQRATAWQIIRWCKELDIRNVMIENVREFIKWGPLIDGRPTRDKEGETFKRFVAELRDLGYTVAYRILNSAHFGDATSRKRLFIQCRKDGDIVWPAPTHMPPSEIDHFPGTQPWRTAREIINWDLPGKSVFGRKKPLSDNTMRRIWTGLERFGGLSFLLQFYGNSDTASVDNPLPTITAQGEKSALIQPFLIKYYEGSDAVSIDEPLPTITANYEHLGLIQPYLIHMEHYGGAAAAHDRRVMSVEKPLPTVTTKGQFGVVQPFLIPFNCEHEGQKPRCFSVDEPLRTVTTEPRFGVAQPYLVQFNGSSDARSIDEPLGTVTTKDRFGVALPRVVQGDQTVGYLDILFRMLTPAELAAAMSFPADYQILGKREDQVRQIGNAVPVRLAKALCQAILHDVLTETVPEAA